MDMVGFLGNNPAVTSFPDVSGRRGNSCCHRCTFPVGLKEDVKNRYIGVDTPWLNTAARRMRPRHASARRMEIPLERFQFQGTQPSRTRDKCLLIAISHKIEASRDQVPLTV